MGSIWKPTQKLSEELTLGIQIQYSGQYLSNNYWIILTLQTAAYSQTGKKKVQEQSNERPKRIARIFQFERSLGPIYLRCIP